LSWQLQLPGRALSQRESQGWLDISGLKPARQTERLGATGQRAVNFHAERGLITFSASHAPVDYSAGVQDRLSWWVQLPAIVQANPDLLRQGESVALRVVGPMGPSVTWVFNCLGSETVRTQWGDRVLWRWQRRPEHAHGMAVDVWLDPQVHHWPVRVRLEGGAALSSQHWSLIGLDFAEPTKHSDRLTWVPAPP
jgi:hypothetical protein